MENLGYNAGGFSAIFGSPIHPLRGAIPPLSCYGASPDLSDASRLRFHVCRPRYDRLLFLTFPSCIGPGYPHFLIGFLLGRRLVDSPHWSVPFRPNFWEASGNFPINLFFFRAYPLLWQFTQRKGLPLFTGACNCSCVSPSLSNRLVPGVEHISFSLSQEENSDPRRAS